MEELSKKDIMHDAKVELRLVIPGSHDITLMSGRFAELCMKIDESHAIRQAALSTGMAWSNAWRLIIESEKILGFPLVRRYGAHGSEVTPECMRLVEGYNDALKLAEAKLFEALEDVLKHA